MDKSVQKKNPNVGRRPKVLLHLRLRIESEEISTIFSSRAHLSQTAQRVQITRHSISTKNYHSLRQQGSLLRP